MIKCKSIYAPPELPVDGTRVYVDRLWPEGITTRAAAVDLWLQELAPSYELWRHGYDLSRWDDYCRRYLEELRLKEKQPALVTLREKAGSGEVTLLYGTSDLRRNNAEIIKEFLQWS